jgi:hypothetical protein
VAWSALLVIADWFVNHGVPTMAGFLGGLVGAEVHHRWRSKRADHNRR